MKTVLVLGSSGQLGQTVMAMSPQGVSVVTKSRQQLDLTDPDALRGVIEEAQPDVVINCAAYTAVDLAEQEVDRAYAVNAAGPGMLARTLSPSIRLIHISTDFVFSKKAERPYRPDDSPAPVSVYGKSKLAGEEQILETRPRNSIILRTSWLYSPSGKNFVLTMLKLLSEKTDIGIIADQFGSPTSTASLARVIWSFASASSEEFESTIYHWSDSGVASWYDFAVEIFRLAREKKLIDHEVKIRPITTAEYPTPATRPSYSALDSSLTERVTGIAARPWQQELEDVLATIKEKQF